jgi:hypothetical protein
VLWTFSADPCGRHPWNDFLNGRRRWEMNKDVQWELEPLGKHAQKTAFTHCAFFFYLKGWFGVTCNTNSTPWVVEEL